MAATKPGNPLDPFAADFPPAVSDMSTVDARTQALRLTAGVKHFATILQLPSPAKLWCFNISQQQLDTLSQLSALECLYLDDSSCHSVQPLCRLPKLRLLRLDSCQKLSSLDDVARMTGLQMLAVVNCKKIRDIAPVAGLPGLTALAIGGGMLSVVKINSLQPIASLARLEFLDLTALRPDEPSLAPLRSLKNLKQLLVANHYPAEEFARLAAALPHTQCIWFSPHVNFDSVACKQCGKHTLVMLTGDKAGTACKTCDRERIERHTLRFEAARR